MTTIAIPAPDTTALPAARAKPRRRITPNLFAISFGLSGLAQAWTTAARTSAEPPAVGECLWLVAGATWVVILALYLRSIFVGRRWRAELSDRVFGPFVSVAPIVGLLLAGGLEPHARTAALALYALSLAAIVLIAARLTAAWLLDDTPPAQWHPGYLLPAVGAPLVASAEAAGLGFGMLAELLFGLGLLGWVFIGTILLHDLVGGHRLPAALIPTLGILLAPPVVAGNAWFAIVGEQADAVALGLAGYAVSMFLVQLGLVRVYRTVPFGPGWWSLSFPFAASAGYAITWLDVEHVPGQRDWTLVVLAAATALVAYLSARTAVAVARHRFLAGPTPTTSEAEAR